MLNFLSRAPLDGETVATRVMGNQCWRFGVFEVDTRKVELCRDGKPVKVREQSFLILVYLLEHAGEVVTREELCRVLWPSDTFVDFDHSLNMAMMKLRETLGELTDTPLYIETIPRRGYRFIAPVSQAADVRNGPVSAESGPASPLTNGTSGAQPVSPAPAETPVPNRQFWPTAAVVGLILLAAVGTVVFLRTRHSPTSPADEKQASSNFQIVPITTAPGSAISPVFSPDGREIAYLWDGPERRRYDVYVQFVGSDPPLQLTHSKNGFIGPPAWSPDGREIAFGRCNGENDGVYIVPALGGSERMLTHVVCPDTGPGPLTWISEGQGMLMIDHCSAAGPFGVVLFSLATGEKQCLTHSGSPNEFNYLFQFSLSPDGSMIAFTASAIDPCQADIYTILFSGGAPHHLTTEVHCLDGLMWTPDGKSIVFVSTRTRLPSLWRVSVNGGPIQRETTYPAVGSFSKDGRRFVYSEPTRSEGPEIWRADLAAAGGPVLDNRNLIHTQYPEQEAQPSPDGAQIAWRSDRTGSQELWMSSATGENPLQLTHGNGDLGTLRWSPDGKWIAFNNRDSTRRHISVIDSEGRNQHSIIDGPYQNDEASWSRDGKSIYFASDRTGSWQVWEHSLESGVELQLTKHGGFDPFESYDGRTIYFSKLDQAGIWSIPADGGTESLVVVDKPQVGYWGYWAITKAGLYLLNADADPRPRIEFYNFATRRTSPVHTLEKRPRRMQPSLSATADGRTVYYTQFDRQSVIKMMEIPH